MAAFYCHFNGVLSQGRTLKKTRFTRGTRDMEEKGPSRKREMVHCKWAGNSQVLHKGEDPYLIEIRKIGCNTNEFRVERSRIQSLAACRGT